MRRIALVDHTKRHRPEPGVLEAIAAALTIQLARDVAPAWGVTPREVRVGGAGDQIHLFDSQHQAGEDFGWHQVDDKGLPYAHVCVDISFQQGSGWLTGGDSVSSTISHEAVEMLIDPGANLYGFNSARRMWACEVCDPVQADLYAIRAGGRRVSVSDFVLPSFFSWWGTAPYDHLGVLTEPFSLAPGGYAVIKKAGGGASRAARSLEVTFDKAMPRAVRRQKLEGWGRTYWRRVLQS